MVVLDDGGRQGGSDVGVDGQCWGRGRGRGVVAERGGGEVGGGAVPRPAHLQGRGVEAVRGGEDGDDVALVLDTDTVTPHTAPAPAHHLVQLEPSVLGKLVSRGELTPGAGEGAHGVPDSDGVPHGDHGDGRADTRPLINFIITH